MAYSEKMHARRLIQMLKRDDVCELCPASRSFAVSNDYVQGLKEDDVCTACRGFLGLKKSRTKDDYYACPCYALGKKRAIERTWIALEEKGYI